MKANMLFETIRSLGGTVPSVTVDTCKTGNLNRKVQKLAVCFIATPRVIHEAAKWGADMILTHEPTFYTHDDTADTDSVTLAKQELIAQTDMVICRFHDGMHTAHPDLIIKGFIKQATLAGDMLDAVHFRLHEPMTPRELATLVKVRCHLQQVRIMGNVNKPIQTLGMYLGAPDGNEVFRDLKEGRSDCVLIGEVCEWSIGEYVRDAAQLGFPKTVMALGHVGSERDGMRALADALSERIPSVETQYFDCDEVFTL